MNYGIAKTPKEFEELSTLNETHDIYIVESSKGTEYLATIPSEKLTQTEEEKIAYMSKRGKIQYCEQTMPEYKTQKFIKDLSLVSRISKEEIEALFK